MNAPIPDTPRNRRIGDFLALIFEICAAHEDADDDQRRDLQQRLRPELAAMKLHRDHERVRERLYEIMPAGWQPAGRWAEGIANPRGMIARELLRRGIHDGGPFA